MGAWLSLCISSPRTIVPSLHSNVPAKAKLEKLAGLLLNLVAVNMIMVGVRNFLATAS
jgi:small neutral amino acid transporter SnatA (MarC family)